jgi:hypothetical protein
VVQPLSDLVVGTDKPVGVASAVPVEISVSGAAGRETRRVVLDPAGGSFTVETRGRPERVALNDDRGLLARFERVSHLPQPAQR